VADEIRFYNTQGAEINELLFRRAVKSIPTPPILFSARNESTDKLFTGTIVIAPGEGQSHSEDLYLGEQDFETWAKSIDVTILPGEEALLKTRAVPHTTPPGQPGRARIGAIPTSWTTL
jgi:hypothetical protein